MARRGNLIPVFSELRADTETPVSAFMKLNHYKNCFLLESVEGGEKWARYSFIGMKPSVVIYTKGKTVYIERNRKRETYTAENPIDLLRAELNRYTPVSTDGLPPFYGGAVGYMSYDMVRFFERLPDDTDDDLGWYDSYFMITDTMVIFDNLRHNIKIVNNVHLNSTAGLRKSYDVAGKTIQTITGILNRPLSHRGSPPGRKSISVKSNFNKNDFKTIVKKAKHYIRRGDIIQAVLSQRFETDLATDPFELYRSLRCINPSPYMYYIKMNEGVICGSSPEVLVRLENDEVVVRPIAGTRPRGKDQAHDDALEHELLNDPKEIAEHVMLVDLGRNDIGRIAQTGSVTVDDLMVVERYSHVMHIVSNVTGRLKKGSDAFDVLAATFPAGTVSGAPKIRAMEIIDELESHKRGPYAGAVGYIGFSGNMDFCITIRTMLIKNNTVYVQAGAGIVMDSNPEREYEETVNKAKGMIKAIQNAYEVR